MSSHELDSSALSLQTLGVLRANRKSIFASLGILAGILYNIWFLGYLFDPSALNNSYVSVLELPGKPYSWLFVLGDVFTGLIVISIGLILWKKVPHKKSGIIGYIVFGVATLLDAIVPITGHCATSVSACGISPAQVLSFHDLASIAAAAGIFVSLIDIIRLEQKHKKSKEYRRALYTYRIWYVTGLLLILGVVTDDLATLSQELFLLACGLALAVIPINLVNHFYK